MDPYGSPYMSYGLKLGWGGPIRGSIGGLGMTFKEYAITLVQGASNPV